MVVVGYLSFGAVPIANHTKISIKPLSTEKDKFNSQLIAATIKHEILTRILILLLLMKYEMFRHRYR